MMRGRLKNAHRLAQKLVGDPEGSEEQGPGEVGVPLVPSGSFSARGGALRRRGQVSRARSVLLMKKCGRPPLRAHTPTDAQLTALHGVVHEGPAWSGRPPFVEFAVWGPFGD